MKLAIASTATLFGYYYFFSGKSLYLYQTTDEYNVNPYYKIYIEGGIAKALNVIKETIDYESDNHIVVIQKALDNLPTRTQKEKVSLSGDFIVTDTIKIPSYTILELKGSIKLANNLNKLLVQEINPIGENTDIVMIGGTYDGNKENQDLTGASSHVIRFTKVANSHFKDIIIQNAVNDNFTLDIGCNNNLCENIVGKLAGTGSSSTNDGNGLVR